jgi:serine/threonine-protein kinase
MKMLHPTLTLDLEVAHRFRREAEAVSRLSHPNTVQVFDFGQSNGAMYLVMELVRGEDLASILRRDGPLPYARACPILAQVCDALSEAHEMGIVHRDLKPENLLVSRTRDGRDLCKVLDFGLAKLRDTPELSAVTARGAILGTPYYMSPEQIRAQELDGRSDVYSLGALLYRVMTGEHPFTGPTPVAVVTAHLTDPLVPPSKRRPDLTIRPEVDAVVNCAMAKDRAQRYQSADELKGALHHAQSLGSQAMAVVGDDARRVSDGREPTGASPAAASTLRREDVDAYERDLLRRRRVALVALPLAITLAGAGVAVWQVRSARGVDIEAEPNNSPGEANRIESERTVRGHIGTRISLEESDRDFYALTVRARTSVLSVALTGIPTMDLKIEVRNATGERIGETDAGGPGDGEVIPNLRVTPGSYTVEVREVWVAGRPATEDSTDWYTLTASWHPLAADEEAEPDDVPQMALPLELDRPMRGYLGRLADVDYFAPVGAGGGRLGGTLSGIEGVDTRLVVLPAGAAAGPPGDLPPGARVFDNGGPGAPERIADVEWPAGAPPPLVVVQRKDRGPDGAGAREALVGLDVPYSLTVHLSR